MQFSTDDLVAATRGSLVGPGALVRGVSIDSRTVVAGSLFVPIVAERDGHDFIRVALEAGADAYLTAEPPIGGSAVAVGDTAVALTDVGRLARRRMRGEVIGVTGSVGKTSTKDLLAAALAGTVVTAASEKSHNNELGVPLTLANAPDDVQAVVVEMGARGVGHIAELCEVAHPTIGVVTTVTAAHTELFGDVAAVARGKSELVEALPASGFAVLNADVPLVAAMAERTDAQVVTFGDRADVRASAVELDDDLNASFTLDSPWGRHRVRLSVAGAHQVSNALAAFAAACAGGADPDAAIDGLARAQLSPWRMEVHRSASGAVVINDAYNANPASTEAALHALRRVPAHRRVAVLATMAELGAQAAAGHHEISKLAGDLDVQVIAVDESRYEVDGEGAAQGGCHVSNLDEALAALGELGAGDAVLLKGSRVAGLERLAVKLLD